MFDFTPLEIIQGVLFLLSLAAKGGLVALVPIIIDQIVSHAYGQHIIPLVLAGIAAINLSNLFYRGVYKRSPRPMMYRGRRRMKMSPDRVKSRMQKEIDAVYDEAWFHNLVLDTRNKIMDATDRANHVTPASWNWI